MSVTYYLDSKSNRKISTGQHKDHNHQKTSYHSITRKRTARLENAQTAAMKSPASHTTAAVSRIERFKTWTKRLNERTTDSQLTIRTGNLTMNRSASTSILTGQSMTQCSKATHHATAPDISAAAKHGYGTTSIPKTAKDGRTITNRQPRITTHSNNGADKIITFPKNHHVLRLLRLIYSHPEIPGKRKAG